MRQTPTLTNNKNTCIVTMIVEKSRKLLTFQFKDTTLTPKRVRCNLFWSQIIVAMAWECRFRSPQIHVPMRKQFQEVCIVTEQGASSIKVGR